MLTVTFCQALVESRTLGGEVGMAVWNASESRLVLAQVCHSVALLSPSTHRHAFFPVRRQHVLFQMCQQALRRVTSRGALLRWPRKCQYQETDVQAAQIILPDTAGQGGKMAGLLGALRTNFSDVPLTAVQRKYFNEAKGILLPKVGAVHLDSQWRLHT